MARVFLSYRRDDSAEVTGRIFDGLRAHFDKRAFFYDVDLIPFGSDFRQVIRKAVEDSQVLLAVIGPTWLSSVTETGTRRLDDPHDWVRLEIETALKRNIPIFPVLVDKALMPKATELPDSLRPLVHRQRFGVGRYPYFSDFDSLVGSISELLATLPEPEQGSAKPNEVIEVGTDDWHKLTERRAELIHKKNRQGLTEPELAEYEQLQRISREVINRTFPRPKLSPDELAVIKQALDSLGE